MKILKGKVADRRCKENMYLSILVDLGVTYRRTLGEAAAREFFDDHDIPSNLALRVLAKKTKRRLTEWEVVARDQSRALEIKK